MIPNLYLLRSKLEFAQRFYIVGEEGITADEAFRFLNNRWRERQVQSEKRNGSTINANRSPLKASQKIIKTGKRKAKEK